MMLLQENPERAVVDISDLLLFTRRIVAGNTELELLDEKVIFQKGSFKRVRRWYRGIHPTLGVIIKGLTGWETVADQDVITPKYYYKV